MADVFLSYAREDSDRAIAVADALKGAGLSVWFDNQIHIASQWKDILTRELEQARCIVMLWSDHAVKSDWVYKEGATGLDRAVLVPVRIRQADIPDLFGSIQFADLTCWNGDATATAFRELIETIRNVMLPHCRIRFDSLFKPRPDDLETLYEAYFDAARRLGLDPSVGGFTLRATRDEQRRLHRLVSSLQVSIEWDTTLSGLFAVSTVREKISERVGRVERHVPLIWLHMMSHAGPFFSSISGPRAHANFLGFASMMFFHWMFNARLLIGQQTHIPSPLTVAELSFPRWEGAISVFFEDSDEIAKTYVTHIDDTQLGQEEVFYGPKFRSQLAYGKSVRSELYTEPALLERYIIPQRELRLALECSTEYTKYRGNMRIRKVTDLDGNDLLPLYDL